MENGYVRAEDIFPNGVAEGTKIYTHADILAGMWVPVTERLPEDGRFLALTTPYIGGSEPVVRILRFSKNLESVNRYDFEGINRSGWYFYDDEYGYIEVDDVTHWMPLPEPPEEET